MRTRPFPFPYALAREYLETYRAEGRSRRRTNAALEARGKLRACAELASSTGLVYPGSARFVGLASDVLREHPIEAGPEWLDRASEALYERIRP